MPSTLLCCRCHAAPSAKSQSYCRPCSNLLHRKWDKKRRATNAERLCCRCHKAKRDGAIRRYCRPCWNAYYRERNRGHPERVTTKVCCRCHKRQPIFGQSYCRECRRIRHREYSREYRRRPGEKLKLDARVFTNLAIKFKVLIPKPCEKCGEKDVHPHHTDYTKPLDVLWLCSPCHYTTHRKAD